jgi:predicted MFS family arabinose efflux permease
MVGMFLAGWLAGHIGWRWTFVALGLPGIAVAVIVRLTLREPARGGFDAVVGGEAGLSLGETVRALWSCTTYRLLLYFIVLSGFFDYGTNQWWPSFYTRMFGLSLSEVGRYLGIAIGVGSGVGLLMGGLLANKVAQHDVSLPLKIGAAAVFLALPAALCSLFVSTSSDSMLLVSLTATLRNVSSGAVIATMYSVVAPRMRATAGALTIFSASMLGFGLGPFCVGVLSDLLVPAVGGEALRYALVAPTCLLSLMAIALFMAAKAAPKDLVTSGNGEPAAAVRCFTAAIPDSPP